MSTHQPAAMTMAMITTIPIIASLPATRYGRPCVLPRALSNRADALKVVLEDLPAKGGILRYAMKFPHPQDAPFVQVMDAAHRGEPTQRLNLFDLLGIV